MYFEWRPYVPVAVRRAKAAREMEKRRKKGHDVSPVTIVGRTIARTFWGKAWCDHMESFSDYENRLPRGRTYVRNGSVVDLQIKPGNIEARVSGSELYKVSISITPLDKATWNSIKTRCAGQIGSLVELLQGKLSKNVIEIITARDDGLLPKPRQIDMDCSCPDSAGMCKHIAAVLYGVGARLDDKPDLLFVLRKVDHLELLEEAASNAGKTKSTGKKTLDASEVADVFGIEFAGDEPAEVETPTPKKATRAKPAVGEKTTKKPAPAAKKTTKKPAPVAKKTTRAKTTKANKAGKTTK